MKSAAEKQDVWVHITEETVISLGQCEMLCSGCSKDVMDAGTIVTENYATSMGKQ